MPVFLVLERNGVIAEDIIGCIEAAGPCRIIHATRAGQIAARLDGEASLAAAVLEMRPGRVVETGLDKCLAARGARIILTMGEEEQALARARGWTMVLRPFTDQMLRTALLGDGAQAWGAGAARGARGDAPDAAG